jgi:acid stress-induced BolA-like protein IbaG/YrbA
MKTGRMRIFQSDDIERLIETGLPCEFVAVAGDDGKHFSAIVVCAAFAGQTLVNRHRMVHTALDGLVGKEIHALQLQTYTPQQWASARGELGL